MGKHKTGRNEPCWCGSGRKYKKCHYEEDRRRDTGVEMPSRKDDISPTHKRLLGLGGGEIERP